VADHNNGLSQKYDGTPELKQTCANRNKPLMSAALTTIVLQQTSYEGVIDISKQF
jgi:hypothetical protein